LFSIKIAYHYKLLMSIYLTTIFILKMISVISFKINIHIVYKIYKYIFKVSFLNQFKIFNVSVKNAVVFKGGVLK
jgi:hypothetical protein